MSKITDLYNKYTKTYSFDILFDNISIIKNETMKFLSVKFIKELTDDDCEDIRLILKMCMDTYTFDEEGKTLISDEDYDNLMSIYTSLGNKRITTTDYPSTTWNIVKHDAPFMVGSVDKTYDEGDLLKYLHNMDKKYSKYILMPKYDGISTVIYFDKGKITLALTRKDGVYGQDITKVVINAKFHEILSEINFKNEFESGYLKCELCVSNSDFEILKTEKEYRNRRSATSGIINTPKNIYLGKFITIIPLYYVSKDLSKFKCWAPTPAINNICKSIDVLDTKDKLLDIIKNVSWEFRCDGIVIFPINDKTKINTVDLLEDAIAFKINTKYANTYVESIYPSVGRTGKVTPMAKVQPCEVNETTVTDVSLSNYTKFINLNIHEGDIVEIYSAGDVIPMINTIKYTHNKGDLLKMSDYCPYCGEKFNLIKDDLFCLNEKCIRIITGKIANFLEKVGAENISDRTIEILYENDIVKSLDDIFILNPNNEVIINAISDIDGFNKISARNICNEIYRIKDEPIEIGTFIGSLGINLVSRKRAKIITNKFSFEELMNIAINTKEENIHVVAKDMSNVIPSIGNIILLNLLYTFKIDHDNIINLMNQMNIIPNKKIGKLVCFTGFRNKEYEEKLEKLGYSYSDSLTKETSLLVAPSPNSESSKIKKAIKYGIPVISISDFANMLEKGVINI